MGSLGRAVASAALAVLMLLGGAVSATADEPGVEPADLADLFPVTTEVEVGPQLPADLPALASLAVAKSKAQSVSTMATGCWTQRWTWSPKSAAGTVLYTYYHVGYWCASGTRVTAARVASAGGETRTPGWQYHGTVDRGAGVVSNQGRSFTQHKFTLRAGGIEVQSPLQCARVKGAATGGSSSDGTCGIY
jgi:hypothetical protein